MVGKGKLKRRDCVGVGFCVNLTAMREGGICVGTTVYGTAGIGNGLSAASSHYTKNGCNNSQH